MIDHFTTNGFAHWVADIITLGLFAFGGLMIFHIGASIVGDLVKKCRRRGS